MPARKTCAVLKEHFDLKLTPGALVQLEARLARRLEPTYQELAALVRGSAVVHADETSWWVGGPGYWLWVFTNRDFTFYVVDKSRGRDVVHDVLGESFAGVLVSDCLAAYEKLSCLQHKCYAHHLRAIADARKEQPNSEFLEKAEMLLKSAIAVGRLRGAIDYARYLELVCKPLMKSVVARPAIGVMMGGDEEPQGAAEEFPASAARETACIELGVYLGNERALFAIGRPWRRPSDAA